MNFGNGSVRLKALLSLGMVLGLGAVGTLAAWTDESTATASFSAGTLDLKLGALPEGPFTDSVALTSLDMAAMYPGASKAGMVSVSNSGTVPLSYTLTGTGTGTLGAALKVSVYVGGMATNVASTGTCSGTLLGTADLPLAGTLISSARTLPATSVESLCLVVKLPSTAENTLQGTTSTATFAFTGSMGS
ncbi:SipW-dependent-type signal peptide-containing protein [Arthrobacter sp.]|uniref:SipW-dependent-type signal peptide-containing protein n=1 Tax=Arthrobacter sp. TaxID=1667 RepID=UPI0028121BA0|nr:SipW-dependent-type signal peptide-containing protein [Arthrobacter sp.]